MLWQPKPEPMDLDNFPPDADKKRRLAAIVEDPSVNPAVKRFRTTHREDVPTVRSTLEQIRQSFPLDRFRFQFPPVIFRHQLYSTLPHKSRTEIDREVNVLRQRNEVRFIKFDLRGDELALIKTEDYREHIRGFSRDRIKNPLLIEKFLDLIENYEVSISTADLKKDRVFTDEDIQALVGVGVLVMREVGSWWLSFPGAGQFMKAFLSGREKVLTMVKKSKYASALENELTHRGLPKRCIGMHYAIHDIIGADLVETATTPSGRLLRYR